MKRPSGAPKTETTKGYVYAVVGSICAGSVSTLAKYSLNYNSPIVVTGLSLLLSSFVLLAYQPKKRPDHGSLRYLIFFGLIGAGLAPLMYFEGLSETTAVNASLLANGEVLFTTVIAYTAFRERLSRGLAARALLIVAGLVIVSTNLDLSRMSFFQNFTGSLLVLGGTLLWGVENNVMVIASRKFDTMLISKFRNMIGGGVLTAAFLAALVPLSFNEAGGAAMGMLALAVAGGTYLFIAAVKRLGAIRMLLVWSSSTVFGAVFALVFLGEQISPAQVLGGVLIIAGVYVFHKGEKVPDAEPFAPPVVEAGR
ncbi:MAG: DMT family transporter [Nitrososphaerota archaeon]|nr:DMT family transporter [Nitrososphaerota archaeon]